MPAASSLTRARRSISDERSIADRLRRRRAEQFDHPAGAGADIEQPADRPVRQARARSPARPRFRRHGASGSSPTPRHGRRNNGRRLRRGRRGPRPAARRRRRTGLAAGRRRASDRRGRTAARSARSAGQRQEDPAAFLAALEQAGVAQDLRHGATRAAGFGRAPGRARRPTAPSSAAARGCAAASDRPAPGKARRAAGSRSPDKDIKISLYASINRTGAETKFSGVCEIPIA